jgi:hypothetical protein
MESASRADRNMHLHSPSAETEGVVSMQTARKPRTSQTERVKAPTTHRRSALGDLLMFLVSFALYGVFTVSLGGLNFDTMFIAVFCSVLTVFVIKALSAGFRGSKEI